MATPATRDTSTDAETETKTVMQAEPTLATNKQNPSKARSNVPFSLFGNTPREFVRIILHTIGISLRRIPKLLREVERKIFHNYGLLIPAIYYAGVRYGYLDQHTASVILGTLSALLFTFEFTRLYLSPSLNDLFSKHFSFLMRKGENGRFTGMPFYMTGAFLTTHFFPPIISVLSILYLIYGDAAAAFVGISFGRTKIGKKSLEGTLAMFLTCLVLGLVLLRHVPFFDQLAFYGALAAALFELLVDHFPVHVDDNLTIPFVSGLALRLAAYRFGVETYHFQF